MKAWLLTWEGTSACADEMGNVAAILNSRMSPVRVKDIAELMYANTEYTLRERVELARNKKNNPWPARFDRIRGVTWEGRIVVGHNPWLHARVVSELVVHESENGGQNLTWTEPSRERIEHLISELSLDSDSNLESS